MKIGRKILLMLGAIFTLSLVALGVYTSNIYGFSTEELSKTFKDFNTSENSGSQDVIKQTKPFSILLMGVDTGSADRTSKWEGNSDSMILLTINPKTNQTTMTSLERDILINLSGPKNNEATNSEAKLNAAYAAGGAQMAIMTIQDMLDITIDKYVQINMEGLVQLVDAVGGITVTNDFDFPISIEANEPAYTATVEPGTHHINGDQALVYARMRYDDPEGDYGRQRRQREVITKVVKKVLALDSVSKYKDILKAVSGNMQTNIEISSSTIPSLLGYSDALKNIKTYQLKGEDATINGGSYQLVTSEHLLTVQNRIKKALGLKTSKTLTTTAILYDDYYGVTLDSGSDGYSENLTADSYSSEQSTTDQTYTPSTVYQEAPSSVGQYQQTYQDTATLQPIQ